MATGAGCSHTHSGENHGQHQGSETTAGVYAATGNGTGNMNSHSCRDVHKTVKVSDLGHDSCGYMCSYGGWGWQCAHHSFRGQLWLYVWQWRLAMEVAAGCMH